MIKSIKARFRRIDALLQDAANAQAGTESVAQKHYQIARETLIQSLLAQPRYADPRRLNRHEFRVFSQSGQDGIIAEIFRRIGVRDRTFVEFGVGAGGGFENNSMYLLAQGWHGSWIEAAPEACDQIARQLDFLVAQRALQLLNARVTAETIVGLFAQLGTPSEFDLLSIDIDSNDYWVWQRLTAYRPRVVVIEYNSFLPASVQWTVPYAADRTWDDLNIEFGASLKSLERLGRELGYTLVACDLTGSDAFFVRNDLVGDLFVGPFTAEHHYEPMRYYLIQRWGYRRAISADFGLIR